MEGSLTGDAIAWLSGHVRWVGPAIFLIAMLESLAIAGLVVPGVALLFAAAAIAGSAQAEIYEILAWAFAGAVCGDMASFALGRIFHQDIRRLSLFRKHPQWIDGGEAFFQRYGVMSVLIGRFVGPIRPVIPLVAGMFDMPIPRFVAINLFSALLWAPVYVLPGYLAGNALKWPVPEFFWTQSLALLGGLLGLLLLALFGFRTQERWSTLAAAALSLAGLFGIVWAGGLLGVFNATIFAWLEAPGSGLSGLARRLLVPLDEPMFLIVLVAGPALALILTQQWRHVVYLLLTAGSCFALASIFALSLGWPAGPMEQSLTVPLILATLLAIAIICNRDQGFWTRMAWSLYCIPLMAASLSAVLTPPPISPLASFILIFQATFAASIALWLTERGAPMQPLSPGLRIVVAAWPLGAALLSLVALRS